MRVVTRADLDGIVCAVLLKRSVLVDDYVFTEAFPLQHGDVPIHDGDIITNLPYRAGCTLWFDHHASNEPTIPTPGKWALTPSAARVVYDYYYSEKLQPFASMVVQTDRVDSADLTAGEIANPSGFFLLELTINPKRPEDEPYWRSIIELLDNTDGSAEKTLQDFECARRANIVLSELESYRTLLAKCSQVEKNLVVTDFRGIAKLPAENRFLVYGMFPQAEVSMKLAEVKNEKGHLVKISLGRSIVNKNSQINLGELLATHGGGGHAAAGSVHVPYGKEDSTIEELKQVLLETK